MSYETCVNKNALKELANVSPDITRIFKEIGIPQNILGYNYLRVAVQRTVLDPQYEKNICKGLYADVAKVFDTTPTRVERSIRGAIETAWNRADLDVIRYYFGNTVSEYAGKPSNSEFICLIANVVREGQYRRSDILKMRIDKMREKMIDEMLCGLSTEYAQLLQDYKEALSGREF